MGKLVNFLDNNLDIIKIALDELMSNPEEEKIFSKFSDEVLKNLTNIFSNRLIKEKYVSQSFRSCINCF